METPLTIEELEYLIEIFGEEKATKIHLYVKASWFSDVLLIFLRNVIITK